MDTTRTLGKFKAPIWGQEIELQEVINAEGGIALMRVRIREKSRFTVFDIDAQTAKHWAGLMHDWADTQATTDADKAGNTVAPTPG